MQSTPLIDRSRWLTVQEASKLARLSASRVRALARTGRVDWQRLSTLMLIERASLLAYAGKQDQKPANPKKSASNGKHIAAALNMADVIRKIEQRDPAERRASYALLQRQLEIWREEDHRNPDRSGYDLVKALQANRAATGEMPQR